LDELARLPLDDLIPHRPPARLLERVLDATDEGAVAELTVREGPWTRAGKLAPEALVEALAQTAALYAGARARREGSEGRLPRAGVLAAVSRFEFPRPARPGDRVRLEVRLQKALGELVAFEARARVGEGDVAQGELRVALVAPP
jgi:3-hydroxymyristoyl/3-hydroxydecanoyl-(acyl carrier protein) dehydratase